MKRLALTVVMATRYQLRLLFQAGSVIAPDSALRAASNAAIGVAKPTTIASAQAAQGDDGRDSHGLCRSLLDSPRDSDADRRARGGRRTQRTKKRSAHTREARCNRPHARRDDCTEPRNHRAVDSAHAPAAAAVSP